MTIANDTEAEIRRLHYAEHWRIGTIAEQLGVHHTTVQRVLADSGVPRASPPLRPSISDPFVPFIIETLMKYPTLTAARLMEMARERGYPGTSDGHFRRIVAVHRPRRIPEAYLRLRTLPGEQAQVDWAHFGRIRIGDADRALMAFVMVLSWSRRMFLRFYTDQRMGSFLRGHVAAFEAFGGVPRVLLYDNLKSAVLERQGAAIRFHPTLLSLAGHYHYEPRPVAVARGNEKGRVERAIRYVRDRFFPARTWRDIDDLNAQADAFCLGIASARPCPGERALTVGAAFEQERPRLMDLPADPFPTAESVVVHVGKTPYVRFDLNDYSVPHTHVQRTLTALAETDRVRILDGTTVIAEHERSYDRDKQIEDPTHIATLVERKREASQHRGVDQLRHAAPNSEALLMAAAARGQNLGGLTRALLRLLETYGPAELVLAIAEALVRGVPHQNAVRLCLERRRQERDLPPAMPVELPDNAQARALVVSPHALSTYDHLEESSDDTED